MMRLRATKPAALHAASLPSEDVQLPVEKGAYPNSSFDHSKNLKAPNETSSMIPLFECRKTLILLESQELTETADLPSSDTKKRKKGAVEEHERKRPRFSSNKAFDNLHPTSTSLNDTAASIQSPAVKSSKPMAASNPTPLDQKKRGREDDEQPQSKRRLTTVRNNHDRVSNSNSPSAEASSAQTFAEAYRHNQASLQKHTSDAIDPKAKAVLLPSSNPVLHKSNTTPTKDPKPRSGVRRLMAKEEPGPRFSAEQTRAANDPDLGKMAKPSTVPEFPTTSAKKVSTKSKSPLAAHLAVVARCKELGLQSRVKRLSEMLITRFYDITVRDISLFQGEEYFDSVIQSCIRVAFGIEFKKGLDRTIFPNADPWYLLNSIYRLYSTPQVFEFSPVGLEH